ncbi:hypothetical protein RFI_09162 [Reticulomyxa filosa]|uniref:Uncharacterized protein n=1 Tax=Reticulomyxa filosa TaxID=46433 RepID=X6NPX7_RETFI|nr:hypothetical protein RFI_09162 [Reticulomyxa filosa]|eukprot:ETO27968.1 hypothetical protein RFI_09162 [Reticulomyxa filosa]
MADIDKQHTHRSSGTFDKKDLMNEDDAKLIIMHEYFRQGFLYRFRNALSVFLFASQIVTDILLAIQFYEDQHTKFSMSIVMIEVSMQLFTWWCTVKPVVSFYQVKDRSKEFLFHSRDLKGNKALDTEKDDKFKTQNKGQMKQARQQNKQIKKGMLRLDTTLNRIQGFLFAGRTGALLVVLLILLYCHNYETISSLQTYTKSVYYISLVVSLCNFLYHLYLSVDFQYFMEMGNVYHLGWSDLFKYLMVFGAFVVSTNARVEGGDAFWLSVYFVIMLLEEACVYQMIGKFGTSNVISQLSMFLVFWAVCMCIFIIQLGLSKTSHDVALVLFAMCGLPSFTLLSRLISTINRSALQSLQGNMTEKELFFYGWILSSETGLFCGWKHSPLSLPSQKYLLEYTLFCVRMFGFSKKGKSTARGHHTYEDFRHKILAINTLIVDLSPDENELMAKLHTRAFDKVFHLTKLLAFTEAKSFWKHRPLYLRALAAWWHKMPMAEQGKKELAFHVVMFIVCMLLRVASFIAPLTTYWFVQEWNPFLHVIAFAFHACVYITKGERLTYFFGMETAIY